jgi:hypothetical protein
MTVEIHSYDGVDYRYTSADIDRDHAIGVIAKILGIRPDPNALDYSLNFFSGGIGVLDRVAIRCRIDASDWAILNSKLRLKSPSDALADSNWAEDFLWLVGGDDPAEYVNESCRNFVNEHKQAFQDNAGADCNLFFSNESDVNSWRVVWVIDGNFNYISFDQG